MRAIVVALTVVVSISLAACGGAVSGAPPTAEPPGTTAPTPVPASPPPIEVASIDLRGRVPPTTLDGGWEVSSCDPGDAPLICILRDGQHVGTIEWLQRPLDADPELVADLQTLPVGDALAANLERSGFYASTERDRRDNCDGRGVAWQRPTDATVGGTAGMAYGYTVRDHDGSRQDVIVSYQAVNGRSLFIVVVEGLGVRTCIPTEGIALTPDQLDAFRPTLDGLVANLRLPAPEATGA